MGLPRLCRGTGANSYKLSLPDGGLLDSDCEFETIDSELAARGKHFSSRRKGQWTGDESGITFLPSQGLIGLLGATRRISS